MIWIKPTIILKCNYKKNILTFMVLLDIIYGIKGMQTFISVPHPHFCNSRGNQGKINVIVFDVCYFRYRNKGSIFVHHKTNSKLVPKVGILQIYVFYKQGNSR